MIDHYEALGVSRNAPEAVIRAAYRARIRETHPDAGGTAVEAQAVNDAYETLSDQSRRTAYDRALDAAQPSTPSRPSAPSPPPQASSPGRGQAFTVRAFEPPADVAWWLRRPSLIAWGSWTALAIALVVASGIVQHSS